MTERELSPYPCIVCQLPGPNYRHPVYATWAVCPGHIDAAPYVVTIRSQCEIAATSEAEAIAMMTKRDVVMQVSIYAERSEEG